MGRRRGGFGQRVLSRALRDAQYMRSGAAQLAQDPARLDEQIGETMDRGKPEFGIRQDGDLRLSAVRRRRQFRQSPASAMTRIFLNGTGARN